MAIAPDKVHPGIPQVKIWSGGISGYNFLLGCTPLMSNECGKLYGLETTQAEGVSGFELFFTRLGVTTKFCPGSDEGYS